MGGGTSKQLICPDDYDKEKFNKILMLYDRLDTNGDHIVETIELIEISQLHVINKIREMKENIIWIKNYTNQKNKELIDEANNKIANINAQLELDIKKYNQRRDEDVKCAENRINMIQGMDDETKAKKFKEAVSDKNGHIEFWTFYKYMKDRVGDIQNIVW